MSALVAVAVSLSACSPFAPGVDPSSDDRAGFVREPGIVRVATWNIESVGAPGSGEYNRTVAVLRQVDADAVALNEVEGDLDEERLLQLADTAGYQHVIVGHDLGFGSDRNVVMSRIPFQQGFVFDGPALSGDSQARDLTRAIVAARLDTPRPLTVVSAHLKSGNVDWEQRFRRHVDAQRLAGSVEGSVPGFDPDEDAVLVTGDLNAEIGEWDGPARWTTIPDGMPSSYWLGSDLYGRLPAGIPGDVFTPLLDLGLDVLDARQPNGSLATRPVSGRRLDYLIASPAAQAVQSAIHTCTQAQTCSGAADHLPVWVDLDLSVPTSGGSPGALAFSELLPNPDACPDADGEWVELHNGGGQAVDLGGLVLSDAAGNAVTLESHVVPAGGYALIGPGRCGPAMDVLASGVSLNNGGDTLFLHDGGTLLASVAYTSSAASPGVAWQVDGSDGCPSGAGTPGGPNPGC